MTTTELVGMLRALAVDASGATDMAAAKTGPIYDVFKLAMQQNARIFTAAAEHIIAEEKRFAEHLEAWRVNNQTHAARIAELEKQLTELGGQNGTA